jgi:excisionase family DNA binding protein
MSDKIEIDDGLLSLGEGAAYLGIKPRSLRELCHAGRITHILVHHRKIRFKPEHLKEFIERKTHQSKKGVYR